MADLLGRSTKVRIRLAEASPDAAAVAERYGQVDTSDGEILLVDGIDDSEIPDLVRDLVSAGARVLSVANEMATLEERFLHLLVKPDDAAADHR